jgi:hypothetical protein
MTLCTNLKKSLPYRVKVLHLIAVMNAKPPRNSRWPVTLSKHLRENLKELLERCDRTFSNVVEEEMRAMIREKGLDPDLPPSEFAKKLEELGYRKHTHNMEKN